MDNFLTVKVGKAISGIVDEREFEVAVQFNVML